MPFVRALPNQYLLAGRGGRLENRGTAVQAFLMPGSVWVLVPSTKQEAGFEFTQETRDGIPLRFKGIVVYRITDPVAAAKVVDFTGADGPQRINSLLADICLGELRHAVSQMTMTECIEQRKTTLSVVIRDALEATVHTEHEDWGLTLEVVQVAQVYITDDELRRELESEVRNQIRLRSAHSRVSTTEQTELAEMAARERVATADRAARQARIEAEAPVRLLGIAREHEVLAQELELQALRNRVRELRVEHDLSRSRAEQALRQEMLPLEQAPSIVEAASGVLRGTHLSLYGEDAGLLRVAGPLFDAAARAVERSVASIATVAEGADAGE
jgi:regulator of protease activity HflC (stomatin/prohibitin superfamily)